MSAQAQRKKQNISVPELPKVINCLKTSSRVGYVTDIEGNYDYFQRYLEISDILYMVDDGGGKGGNVPRLELRDDAVFVFGGDLFDKGPGDIRVGRMLVNLKKRYWDRCFLLIGNRDANKLRLSSELSEDDIYNRPIESVPKIGAVGCKVEVLHYLKQKRMENNEISRLKWLLEHTLGSPNAFEFRREEMMELGMPGPISDKDVYENFIKSVDPSASPEDAFILEYLRVGQLAVAINDLLFVHGGINPQSIRFVHDPKYFRYFNRDTGDTVYKEIEDIPGGYIESERLEDWIEALNDFKSKCLLDYEENPLWHEQTNKGETYFRRGGEGLAACQSIPATLGTGVVVPTFYAPKDRKEATRPNVFPSSFLDYFSKNGINTIIVGHKPVGNTPLFIRASSSNKINGYTDVSNRDIRSPESVDNLMIIMGDTSFSDPSKMDELGHTRGAAVAEIEFTFNNGTSIRLNGIMPDGAKYDFTTIAYAKAVLNNRKSSIPDTDTLIGRVTNDDYWVKAKLSVQDYLLAKTVGRNVDYKIVSKKKFLRSLI